VDFSSTDHQLRLKASIVEFARKELNKNLIERDHEGVVSRENWQKCADFGIQGLAVPKEFGGSGFDILTTIMALEGLGYGCHDNGLIFAISAQMLAVQAPILQFGSSEQKARYLPALVSGRIIGAHAMTEPDSGSDSFGLSTKAEKHGERYRLTGTKTFITNAPFADLFLVFATVNKARGFMGITAFLIDKDTPGLSVGPPIEKLGLRTAQFGKVILDECDVGPEHRLGHEGNGGSVFIHAINSERAAILASHLGMLERQLERCVEYAKTREQFGKPIGSFQLVSSKIVNMKTRLETARLLLYKAGWLRAQGQEATQEVAMAKLYLSECSVQSSLDAIQIFGGYGFTKECEIERDLRDSIASKIYSGTSEIQIKIIARSLGL
jgi:alkylation response protein AidB-like acyl-CoA dehydrogenase